MRAGSLRRRLLAASAASLLLALAMAGFGLVLLFERHVERRIALELEADLRQLLDGLGRVDGSLYLARPPAEPRFLEPLSGRYWQITEEAGALLLRSRSLWDVVLQLPPDTLQNAEVHRHILPGPAGSQLLAVERSVMLPESLGGGGVRVVVAIDRAEVHVAGWAFATELAPSLALLAVMLMGAAWLQVTLGLRPLDTVRRKLAAVRAGTELRLGAVFPEEVRPLAAEVDHLLDQQEAALVRARARAADLAHGLKTPLTVLIADAAHLRERGETHMAEEIAAVAESMRRHVERELARARAGAGRSHVTSGPGVRLAAEQIVRVLQRTPRGQELEWIIEVPDDLRAGIDAQDLAEIFGNLAENALKWAKSRVRVAGCAGTETVTLLVEDDGPGIPGQAIETALARGGRLDTAKPGTGLGLAIVGDLVDAYGGSLELGRSEGLGGLRTEIRLAVPHWGGAEIPTTAAPAGVRLTKHAFGP